MYLFLQEPIRLFSSKTCFYGFSQTQLTTDPNFKKNELV
jgi:hypothetical protein